MKLLCNRAVGGSVLFLLSCICTAFPCCFAWSQSSQSSSPKAACTTTTATATTATNSNSKRRRLLQQVLGGGVVAATSLVPSKALAASAGAGSLLEEFGADPKVILQKDDATSSKTAAIKKGEAAIDPTLRASYYYPTAKKRYLPRILKVSNGIGSVSSAVQSDEWDKAEAFVKDADNAILPLKLYVSSLDGQGLGMANSYASLMKRDSQVYEQNVALLQGAIAKRNKELALQAITEMGVAVTEYRQTGKLTDDDGNIPSVDEMRRMAMRKPTIAIASNK